MKGDDLEGFIRNERHDFSHAHLGPEQLAENPLEQLKYWIQQAIDSGVPEPYAMSLATCLDGQPNVRVVYVREFHNEGLVFYTNYKSKKGKEIEQNPKASLNFFWAETERQVRLEGTIVKAPASVSDSYFSARPRESKIGAWASEQSDKLTSRSQLEEKITAFTKKYEGSDIPRPDFWGGYIFKPHYYEFWQGNKNRLHHRVIYKQQENIWLKSMLYP